MSSRRKFLQQGTLLTGGALLASAFAQNGFAYFRNNIMPSDQVRIGAIGINGMGWSNVTAALKVPGVVLAAICDIDQSVISKRQTDLQKMGIDPNTVRVYNDYRKLLDQKDIDAVIIGTPDHWHALQMIHACEAGKDVYVEKPVGNSIVECNAMVAAQQKYGKIVQAGQWQRSQQHFTDAVNFVHSGQLGNVRTVKVWCYLDWKQPLDHKPDSAVPAGVDYKQWLGPAQNRPFNINRFHFTFRWFWDYAGGLMTDWGVHLLDYALMGMKADTPKSIATLGGKFAKPDSADETPDTLMALYEFDKFNIVWDHALGIGNGSYNRDHGIAFIGNAGTLVLNRNGWEVIEEKKNEPRVAIPFQKSTDNGLNKHWENFISVVRSRKAEQLNCSIQEAAKIARLSQMGNIAYRTNQKLFWNTQQGKFTDNNINQKYLAAQYHNGYKLPII
ncbi:Gfo/Idh/MocA family protein [Sediminibacterium goheungense]|uniref:Putative dehydrogenase n=1 Tax=Sediminibacterium goheungense TaxID=1086393 RepID=A0A4R6J1X5_9BACT|nr:Gfo/Idh/MocA family oxidoreductase [Sediminibacterium goheungense]TDO29262.1 putative dehydrogenase [Sediminibacterium goheungense]